MSYAWSSVGESENEIQRHVGDQKGYGRPSDLGGSRMIDWEFGFDLGEDEGEKKLKNITRYG